MHIHIQPDIMVLHEVSNQFSPSGESQVRCSRTQNNCLVYVVSIPRKLWGDGVPMHDLRIVGAE